MAVSADAQKAADQLTAKLMADPVLGPLLKRQAAGQPFDSNAADARLKELGIELPQGMWISKGKVQHENMTVDNIGKALKIALPIVITAGALGGFGAPGAGGGATAPVAAASGGLWSKLAAPLITTGIQAGTNLLGTKMEVNANERAAEIAAKSAEDALNWQKDVYGQRQEQLAPTIGVGNGATRALGNLMGIAEPEGGYHAPPAPGSAPPSPPATAPAAPTPSAGVKLRAPNGQVQLVTDPAQVQHYVQLGATVVQ